MLIDAPARGALYRPRLSVQKVRTRGVSHRYDGLKTDRVHHYHSDLEAAWFLVWEWDADTIDIREQFDLSVDSTVPIAAALGVPHPPRSRPLKPEPLSTDFVVTRRFPCGGIGEVAAACKYTTDLPNPRTRELLEIERRYWRARGVPWDIATERDLPRILVRNLRLIRPLTILGPDFHLTTDEIAYVISDLRGHLAAAPTVALWRACLGRDQRVGLVPGTALALVYHAIATRKWTIDLTLPLDPDRPLVFTETPVTVAAVQLAASSPIVGR